MTRTIGDMLDSPQELQSWLHDITACQAMLHAVATTRLLEQWDSQPVTLAALAARTGMEEARLGRLIRLLAAQGILELRTDGSIGHTPRSRNLRAFRSSIMVQRIAAQSGLHLGEALRTGATAFETCFGKPVFEYFAENPEQAGYFGERMSQMTAQDEPLLLAQLGGPFTLAVDIGGSHGTLLAGLLEQYPQARGIVFDLPDVAQRAAGRSRTLAVGGRVEAVGGDFFRSVPAGGDLYVLKQILHNWDDGECIAILKSVREAIAPGGRVAIIDRVLPDTVGPDVAFLFDILMLIWSTGQERTLCQFQTLLERAGFATHKVTVNQGRLSIIEARPVRMGHGAG
ncbi:MAG TPA: methyltransferase [Steroidobacteraceae bacterium]|nr:methyltransferase [Steroidobacteraceae bacterium]